jgi:hypothetical protein
MEIGGNSSDSDGFTLVLNRREKKHLKGSPCLGRRNTQKDQKLIKETSVLTEGRLGEIRDALTPWVLHQKIEKR